MYSEVDNRTREKSSGTMHLDYDKTNKTFYNNIYFKDCKCVLKMPLVELKTEVSREDIKIEKFNLTKYVYLVHYELNA